MDMQEKKRSWRVLLFRRQALLYRGNVRRLKLMTRIWRSKLTFTKQKNNDIQWYKVDLQTYQNDHIDKVEIISLPKKCNKTGAKTDEKAGAKASAKVPWSTFHFFQSQKKLSKYCIKNLYLCRRLKGQRKLPEYSKYPEKKSNLMNQEMISAIFW